MAAHEDGLIDDYVSELAKRGIELGATDAREQYLALSFQTLMVAVISLGLGSLTERDDTVRTVLHRSIAAIDRLGFRDWIAESVRTPGNTMTFLTLGSHHELALLESKDSDADGKTLGVDHFAFKLEGGLPELAAAKQELERPGHEVAPIDHVVTKSRYFRDPDGNKVELYIDGVDWRKDPKLIYSMKGFCS